MRAALVCLISLAGCAQISGLDTLDVGDATSPVDGTSFEDALPKADAADASESPDHDASDAKTKDANTLPDAIIADVVSDACTSPASCSNGAVCCETLDLSGAQQNCVVDATTIVCASPNACATSIPFSCTKYVLRRCIAATDCTENLYDKCCTVSDASSDKVCLSAALASYLHGTCL